MMRHGAPPGQRAECQAGSGPGSSLLGGGTFACINSGSAAGSVANGGETDAADQLALLLRSPVDGIQAAATRRHCSWGPARSGH